MPPSNLEQKHDIESVEAEKKKPQLSEKQLQYADEQLDKAVKDGTLRREDRMKVYAQMDKMTSAQIANAESILDEYIGKKREKREEYSKELDDAVSNGLMSVDEHKEFMKKYDKMPGKERQKEMEEKWPKRLEMKKMVKKEFSALLEESPHFFHEGKLTAEGQSLLDEHNSKIINDREKLVLKKRLIRKIKKFDGFSELCKERYQVANEHYVRGNYETAARLMKKNSKTCERYPDSARLKEFNDFAKGDHNNAVYEQLKNEKMNDKREEVQECFQGKDHESALNCASEAVQMMKKIISTTYDGKNGEYQEGSSPEKQRADKWVTPYMTNMLTKVKNEEAQAKNVFETFQKEEQAEEQQILDGEMDLIDQEQASDKRDQLIIKAALDSAEGLTDTQDESTKEEPVITDRLQSSETPQKVDSSPFNQADKEEEQDLQDNFVDEQATQHEESSESLQPQASNQDEITQQEAQSLSSEELSNQKVSINEEGEGKMDEQKADDILRSKAELKLTKDGRELQTEQEIKQELASKLSESRLKKIDELKRAGKITHENAALHKQEAQEISANQVGQDLISQNRSEQVVQFEQQQNTQSRLGGIFKRNTDKNKLQEQMRQNAEKKKEQMRKAA